MGYIQGATKMLLCQVLPGKVFDCTALIHGAALKSGYDSHTSPDKKELVIFNSHHILPSYIVHYETAGGDFKYTTTKASTSTSASDAPDADVDVKEIFYKAAAANATSVFKGQKVLFSGTFCDTQAHLNTLVGKHKGGVGTVGSMTVLVAGDISISNKLAKAKKKGVPVVKELFIYDCIIKKKFLDVEDYQYEV